MGLSGMKQRVRAALDNQHDRHAFVTGQLSKLAPGSLLLDAGCGEQQYRRFCGHLDYRGQDFGAYRRDEKQMIGGQSEESADWAYGPLDYVGDIWSIDESDAVFDAVLCTEVFEHIPYPVDAVRELSRLLKPGGTLILTTPSNCLRHQDPFFFTSGFSDRWFEMVLPAHGLEIESIAPVGDYYRWIAVELARTARTHSVFTWPLLLPAFLYFMLKKPTRLSIDTLCMGYYVVARKKT